MNDRIVSSSTNLTDNIKRNSLSLFNNPPVKRRNSHAKFQVSSLKEDCHLFSRLYIACQNRDGNLDQFFAHENSPIPPSLSSNGRLRPCTKSDLVHCLTRENGVVENVFPEVSVVISMAQLLFT